MIRKNKDISFPLLWLNIFQQKSREQKYKGSEILDFDSMI